MLQKSRAVDGPTLAFPPRLVLRGVSERQVMQRQGRFLSNSIPHMCTRWHAVLLPYIVLARCVRAGETVQVVQACCWEIRVALCCCRWRTCLEAYCMLARIRVYVLQTILLERVFVDTSAVHALL